VLLQIGCGKFFAFSARVRKSANELFTMAAEKPCMPEKPGFIGAIWDFRSASRSSEVHLRFI
jgi:hypothetical protein